METIIFLKENCTENVNVIGKKYLYLLWATFVSHKQNAIRFKQLRALMESLHQASYLKSILEFHKGQFLVLCFSYYT